jgi:hypothetical protein
MTTKMTDEPWADALRQLIRASGKSTNTVAREAGLNQPRLYEFVKGGGMSLANAQRLAAYFGLELRPRLRGRG